MRLPHVTALADIPDHFSMPSGHACAAMSSGIAVHYVTDVVTGQALGAAAAILVHLTLS